VAIAIAGPLPYRRPASLPAWRAPGLQWHHCRPPVPPWQPPCPIPSALCARVGPPGRRWWPACCIGLGFPWPWLAGAGNAARRRV